MEGDAMEGSQLEHAGNGKSIATAQPVDISITYHPATGVVQLAANTTNEVILLGAMEKAKAGIIARIVKTAGERIAVVPANALPPA